MSIELGILGGMGPRATLKLFDYIIANTPASRDQDHIRMFIDNNTKVPDRTDYLLGLGPNPLPELINSAHILDRLGVSYILIPCNTGHMFINDIQKVIKAKIIDMIEETSMVLKRKGVKRVCLFATLGTIKSHLYYRYFSKYDIELILPSVAKQQRIHEIIYNQIKAENYSEDHVKEELEDIYYSLPSDPEILVKGCTEISLINFSIDSVDPLEILAKVAIDKVNKLKYS